MTHFIKALIVVSAFLGMTNLTLAEPNQRQGLVRILQTVSTVDAQENLAEALYLLKQNEAALAEAQRTRSIFTQSLIAQREGYIKYYFKVLNEFNAKSNPSPLTKAK